MIPDPITVNGWTPASGLATITFVDGGATGFSVTDGAGNHELLTGDGDSGEWEVLLTDASSDFNYIQLVPAQATLLVHELASAGGAALLQLNAGTNVSLVSTASGASVASHFVLTPTALTLDVPMTLPQVISTPVTPTITAGAVTVDWSTSMFQILNMVANTTITWANAVAGEAIVIEANASGAWTLAFPAGTLFPGGTQVAQTASGTDTWTVSYDGTNYFALCSGQAWAT